MPNNGERGHWLLPLIGLVLVGAAFFALGRVSQFGAAPTLDSNFLLAVANIALFILAIVVPIALALAVAWATGPYSQRMADIVRRQVEEHLRRLQDRIAQLERANEIHSKEVTGLQLLVSGFIFGRLARIIRPDDKVHQGLLDLAIADSQEAYARLPENTDNWIRAANNLAFYLSLSGDVRRAVTAVKIANMLLERYQSESNPEWLNTYAAVLGAFHDQFDSPMRTKQNALSMLERITDDASVSEAHKQNARRHYTAIRRALEREQGR